MPHPVWPAAAPSKLQYVPQQTIQHKVRIMQQCRAKGGTRSYAVMQHSLDPLGFSLQGRRTGPSAAATAPAWPSSSSNKSSHFGCPRFQPQASTIYLLNPLLRAVCAASIWLCCSSSDPPLIPPHRLPSLGQQVGNQQPTAGQAPSARRLFYQLPAPPAKHPGLSPG
jgi:hypothetical protein